MTKKVKILIIDDDIAVLESIGLLLRQNNFMAKFAESPDVAIKLIAEDVFNLVILDMNFTVDTSGRDGINMLKQIKKTNPFLPVILITGWGHMSLAIEGMKEGAVDFINKPWDNKHLIQSVQSAIALNNESVSDVNITRKELDDKYNFYNIIGQDQKLVHILKVVSRVCKTNASVLITGESGTGKELIAEALHYNSNRKDKPFVKVNLGGMSSTLFDSEMFGHKKGAFTDAYIDRIGRFDSDAK